MRADGGLTVTGAGGLRMVRALGPAPACAAVALLATAFFFFPHTSAIRFPCAP